MKWKRSKTAAANAARVLPPLVEEYFKAGRKAAGGKRSPKQLHKFRIATKRFRYTLEQFRPVYGAVLERRLDPVRDLQSVLGRLHDFQAIGAMLPSHDPLQARLTRSFKKKLREFHGQWTAFDAAGQLERWQKFLAAGPPQHRSASRKGKPRTAAKSPNTLRPRPRMIK
jgi:CHAD domain-containing protein